MPSLYEILEPAANPPRPKSRRSAVRHTRGLRYVPPLQILGGLLRLGWPIPRAFGWALVTRYDDVAEVLSRPDVFAVPFGDEMARLNDPPGSPGTPFILGIDDPQQHDAQATQVMAAFKREDVPARVALLAWNTAHAVVAAAGGKLEAIGGLITAVPIEICKSYYGVDIQQPEVFAQAAIRVSGHLFGPPPIQPDPSVDQQATIVRNVVDSAIQAAQSAPPGADTVVARLVAINVQPAEIRAFLMGMIIGFVPTNTMAGGHILEMLLKRPGFLAAARQAAQDGDDELLARCLFEALRYMPINFGPFRECKADYTLAAGTRRETCIAKGTKVLASTMSAMFDCEVVERPFDFIPGRPAAHSMHFGFGMHWCVGAFIARAQITQTFKALVLQEHLQRRSPLKNVGGFPKSLWVSY